MTEPDLSTTRQQSVSIAQIVDDHLRWVAAWHNAAFFGLQNQHQESQAAENLGGHADRLEAVRPPQSFHLWFAENSGRLIAQQPIIDRLAIQHDQLHTLARMVLLKTATAAESSAALTQPDYALVMARFEEFMGGLRRLERAFAVAASGLDPLTGLRSRVGMQEDCAREQARLDRGGPVYCIALLDIDHFKAVNDTHGHPVGDRVLSAVADVITRTLRSFDDAYRAGGEEFLLVLKGADVADAYGVLERLRSALAATSLNLASGESLSVTASFGVVEAQPGLSLQSLLERADAALYQAKKKGRNRIELAETLQQG